MSRKCYSFTVYFSKSYLEKMVNLNQLVMQLQKDKKTENMNLNQARSNNLQTQKAKLDLQY